MPERLAINDFVNDLVLVEFELLDYCETVLGVFLRVLTSPLSSLFVGRLAHDLESVLSDRISIEFASPRF